ncbi:MAG TPA: hypothetical protein VFC19_26225 [Candidatus Limnocylindrales bacterium]|nr:hypothetical protein [Candidatus Limnocylindrales bacterium]
MRLTLVGVGAMNSPRFAPAGLLVRHNRCAVLLDGVGSSGIPLDAWLVCDLQSELRSAISRAAASIDLTPTVSAFSRYGLTLTPHPVSHTSHPTYGYTIQTRHSLAVWAPEFWTFPSWAFGAGIMFAEAAGWNRPIRFRGGVGGHASALAVCEAAQAHEIGRLVLAHIGRPSIRAIDAGLPLPFGEWGTDGATYTV